MKKWLAVLTMVILVAIDQITKIVGQNMLQGKEPFVILKGVLELHYLEGGNTGAAFGIFAGKTLPLGILSIVVSVVLFAVFWRMSKEPKNASVCWTLVFLISGAIGNGIDRIVREYVIDFIYFKLIDFPVFNVADIYVTGSAIVMFLLIAFSKDEKKE